MELVNSLLRSHLEFVLLNASLLRKSFRLASSAYYGRIILSLESKSSILSRTISGLNAFNVVVPNLSSAELDIFTDFHTLKYVVGHFESRISHTSFLIRSYTCRRGTTAKTPWLDVHLQFSWVSVRFRCLC